MKKLLSIVVLLSALLFSNKAIADFDGVNYIPGQLTTIQEGIQSEVIRPMDKTITQLRDAAKFDPSNIISIDDAFLKLPKIEEKKLEFPDYVEDANDPEKTAENLQKNVISQITIDSGNTTELARKEFLDTKIKRMKDFSDLYAKAFTVRTNLAREEAEATKRTSSQSIIKSSSTVDNRVTVRFNNIRAMNAAYMEFLLSDQVQVYRNNEEEKNGGKNEK